MTEADAQFGILPHEARAGALLRVLIRFALPCFPTPNCILRNAEYLAEKENFLEDWRVAGSIRIVGDLEQGSRELRELFEKSRERSTRRLAQAEEG